MQQSGGVVAVSCQFMRGAHGRKFRSGELHVSTITQGWFSLVTELLSESYENENQIRPKSIRSSENQTDEVETRILIIENEN